MKVIMESSDFRLPATVVSIGMFDGVHRGHTKVLRQLRSRGLQLGVSTAVVTFDPHPRAVVRPDARPMLLSSLDDRMQLLAATGAVDHCLVLRFDQSRSEQPADEFVLTMLVHQLGMRELIVGENFACGRGRQGTVSYLATLGQQLGFAVAPVRLDAVPGSQDSVHSSSTEARRLIQLGDLAGASAMLQRPHEMTGTITRAVPASRRVIEAELPTAMCAPAAADYVGAVKRSDTGSPWIPALLRVRGDRLSSRRMVHLVADDEVEADLGDLLRMRFVDRARHDPAASLHEISAA
ncbi:FAD synthetase family protein [Variovorax guangxiensis]|uniref:FAD synthetase family protein n=1 Tax=Variovorax guangxiensis TaxID=1775474 RepID=UPI002857030E|nr:FAD synthetase family protein [Variovorax guangxiensis]MDR6858915.1 riboflavin kinase/FMN adenylyltransferase [Variovorax guangxiensis]